MQPKSVGIGIIIGVLIAVVVGFKFFGWKTRAGAAETATAAMKQSAVCVGKFAKSPDFAARAKELAGKYAFEVAPFLEKGGWSTVEGTPPAYSVSEACAAGVEVLVGTQAGTPAGSQASKAGTPAGTPASKAAK